MASGRKTFRRTTSRVLTALFNILGERINGARFLDLYAGEGTVGVEALLRGAREALFVEADRRRSEAIRRGLARKGLSDRAWVFTQRVESFLKNYRGNAFDIVFLDPPYHDFQPDEVLEMLSSVVGPETLVVLEHFHKSTVPESGGGLNLKRQYRYGDTVLSIYERQKD